MTISDGNTYCGECPIFKHEDADGYGFCNLSHREQRCDDMCSFLTFDFYMTREQTVKVLHLAQKWRRGSKQKMLPPRLFGLAIDNAIRELRKINNSRFIITLIIHIYTFIIFFII